MLSIESLVPALTVFGLLGLAIQAMGVVLLFTLGGAVAGGFITMLVAAALLRTMTNLGDEGTVQIDRAIGHVAAVYLTIPGANAGRGKITLTIQNRTMEFPAVTYEDGSLPTGSKVVVSAIHEPGTVEVVSASKVLPEQGI